jgi:hypothetical protein
MTAAATLADLERHRAYAKANWNGDVTTLNEWPLWAEALAKFSKPEDRGIGDVIARMIGDEKSARFKAWYLATFGRVCGCNGRQEKWNRMYPLRSDINALR